MIPRLKTVIFQFANCSIAGGFFCVAIYPTESFSPRSSRFDVFPGMLVFLYGPKGSLGWMKINAISDGPF
jgi:hypothetical protein